MNLRRNKNKGFSLVELVVVIGLMAILATFTVSSYVSQLQIKRAEMDEATLANIDTQMQLLVSYEDVFNELLPYLESYYEENKPDTFVMLFQVEPYEGRGHVILEKTTISDTDFLLKDKCKRTYKYLVDTFGERIKLESQHNRYGNYTVYCRFNGTQVSGIRNFSVRNDAVSITHHADLREEQIK